MIQYKNEHLTQPELPDIVYLNVLEYYGALSPGGYPINKMESLGRFHGPAAMFDPITGEITQSFTERFDLTKDFLHIHDVYRRNCRHGTARSDGTGYDHRLRPGEYLCIHQRGLSTIPTKLVNYLGSRYPLFSDGPKTLSAPVKEHISRARGFDNIGGIDADMTTNLLKIFNFMVQSSTSISVMKDHPLSTGKFSDGSDILGTVDEFVGNHHAYFRLLSLLAYFVEDSSEDLEDNVYTQAVREAFKVALDVEQIDLLRRMAKLVRFENSSPEDAMLENQASARLDQYVNLLLNDKTVREWVEKVLNEAQASESWMNDSLAKAFDLLKAQNLFLVRFLYTLVNRIPDSPELHRKYPNLDEWMSEEDMDYAIEAVVGEVVEEGKLKVGPATALWKLLEIVFVRVAMFWPRAAVRRLGLDAAVRGYQIDSYLIPLLEKLPKTFWTLENPLEAKVKFLGDGDAPISAAVRHQALRTLDVQIPEPDPWAILSDSDELPFQGLRRSNSRTLMPLPSQGKTSADSKERTPLFETNPRGKQLPPSSSSGLKSCKDLHSRVVHADAPSQPNIARTRSRTVFKPSHADPPPVSRGNAVPRPTAQGPRSAPRSFSEPSPVTQGRSRSNPTKAVPEAPSVTFARPRRYSTPSRETPAKGNGSRLRSGTPGGLHVPMTENRKKREALGTRKPGVPSHVVANKFEISRVLSGMPKMGNSASATRY